MLDHTTAGNFSFTTGDLILTVGKVTDPSNSGLNMTVDGLEIDIVMKPIEALEVRLSLAKLSFNHLMYLHY